MVVWITKEQKEKFYQSFVKGPEDACWLWTNKFTAVTNYKQPYFCIGHTVWKAARLAYALANNLQSIGRWEYICHTCDNSMCVNPKHLYLGNAKTNAKDASDRGRYNPKFKQQINAKITKAQATCIKKLSWSGLTCKQVSNIFRGIVNSKTVSNIKHGYIWPDIKYNPVRC